MKDRFEPSLDPAELRLYTQRKLAVGAQVRALAEALKNRGSEPRQHEGEDLIVKLAEDRFTLAVLGQFKRGKSSLMNAIIGRELLPTGVLPLTSAITVLKFGPSERLVIERDGYQFRDVEPVSKLADFVTETGNPGNRLRVRTACVEVPVSFLRRGLEFVDTPGVGSAIEANTATTYAFLPKCDAALFVTSADLPLGDAEVAFLRAIRGHVGKIFYVVNKTDLLSDPGELQQMLDSTTHAIGEVEGAGKPQVLPLSARLGLQAWRDGDEEGYARSGLKAMQETLARFLTGEKASVFLEAIIEKAIRLIQAEISEAALGKKHPQPPPWLRERPPSSDLDWSENALDAIKKKLLAIQSGLRGHDLPEAAIEDAAPPAVQPAPITGTPDLSKDLKTRGCPVCNRLVDTLWDFFAHFQYRLDGNEKTQAGFATQQGFCPLHTWQLQAVMTDVGASAGFARIAERTARLLREAPDPAHAAEYVRGMTVSPSCRACACLRQAEADEVARFAAFLREPAHHEPYSRSQGVCMRHLATLLALPVGAEMAPLLMQTAIRNFERLAEDMQSFVIQCEARRRGFANADEADAHLRAIIHLAGDRSLCVPWTQEIAV